MLQLQSPIARRTRLAAVLMLSAFFAVSTMSGAEVATTTVQRQSLVYTSFQPGPLDLYALAQDGEIRRLTDHPALDYNPALSPDGRWLVFTSERHGSADLWALPMAKEAAAVPGMPVKLTDSRALDDAASFSADGKSLVFVSTRGGYSGIYTMPFRPDRPATAEALARHLTPGVGGNFNPAFSPDGRRIVFSSNRDVPARGPLPAGEGSHVYVMASDGSDVRRLTHHDGWSWSGMPTFSADGRRVFYQHVAYDRFSPASVVIRSIDVDGEDDPHLITRADGLSAWPAVSADGRLIFAGQRDGFWQILAHSDGGEGAGGDEERILAASFDLQAPSVASGLVVAQGPGAVKDAEFGKLPLPGGGYPFRPAVRAVAVRLPALDSNVVTDLQLVPVRHPFAAPAPDRRRWATSGMALAVSDLDGNSYELLEQGPLNPFLVTAWGAKWSPDGSRLVVSLGPAFAPIDGSVDIWSLRPDGSGRRNLTADSPANDGFPAFSPDGRYIVFRSGRSGNFEIYRMAVDGSDGEGGDDRQVLRLTNHEAKDTMPSYSPDGRQIAFTSLRDGDFEVYTLDLGPDGEPGQLRRITDNPGFDMHPHYSPDGRWLIVSTGRYGMNDERPFELIPQPYGELAAIRLADLHTVRLTHSKWEDGLGVWIEESAETLFELTKSAAATAEVGTAEVGRVDVHDVESDGTVPPIDPAESPR